MEVIYDPEEPFTFSTSVAIGNFDGVHLGHRYVIDFLRKVSSAKFSKLCVVTFDPHPQKVLSRKEVVLIMPFREKIKLLENLGVDVTVCLSFTQKLSEMTAEDFVEKILVDLLRIKDIIVGPGFMFGNKRLGNTKLLSSLGEVYGYDTTVLQPKVMNNEKISSSLLRRYLLDGNVQTANRLLGYTFFIEGVVVAGEKRGRKIGFPTTNIRTDWELLPKPGVYATYAIIKGKRFKSITNIGYRPTFGESNLLVETYILDFSRDVYGAVIRVEFVKRLRDEKKFNSVNDLISKIKLDVKEVRDILEKNGEKHSL